MGFSWRLRLCQSLSGANQSLDLSRHCFGDSFVKDTPQLTMSAPTMSVVSVWLPRYARRMTPPAERRARMQVRIFRSHAEQAREDAAYWAALPASERVLEVWCLSEEQWRLRGDFPNEPGLCRSVARLQRA